MKIEIEFSQDGMWGDSDVGQYDVAASIDKFSSQLLTALTKYYPYAKIEVRHGINDYTMVDDDYADDEVPVVEDVLHSVWESWEWVVEK